MKQRESEPAGPITDFLVEDHRRLESLLQQAVAHAEQEAYAQFRAGLLRHIGMEEKILIQPSLRVSAAFSKSTIFWRKDRGACMKPATN